MEKLGGGAALPAAIEPGVRPATGSAPARAGNVLPDAGDGLHARLADRRHPEIPEPRHRRPGAGYHERKQRQSRAAAAVHCRPGGSEGTGIPDRRQRSATLPRDAAEPVHRHEACPPGPREEPAIETATFVSAICVAYAT